MKNGNLEQLRELLAANRKLEALRRAAAWPHLGAYKEDITRGWAAYRAADMYRDMGHDPHALIDKGIAAVKAMAYGAASPAANCGRAHPHAGCNCGACRRARPRARAVSPMTKKGP